MTLEQQERIEQAARDFAHGYGVTVEQAAAKINVAMQGSVPALRDLFERTAAFIAEGEERWLRSLPWHRRLYWRARRALGRCSLTGN